MIFIQIQTNQNPFIHYRCADGTIKPCASTKYGYAPAAMEAVSVFSIACFLIVIVLLLVVLLGSVVFVIRFGHLKNYFVHSLGIESFFTFHFCICRKRRICQPFSHARLNECVEMTNPMYVGELDDTPAFIQTNETKVNYRWNFQLFRPSIQYD